METITEATLSSALGVAVSLLFSYVPGLRTWYAAKEEDYKKLFMLVVLAALSLGIVLISCFDLVPLIACSKAGIIDFVVVFVSALIGNQATYPISPKATDVRMLKEARG